MRLALLGGLAALLAVGLLAGADVAAGCSCLDRDERDRLEDGETAILGRVVSRDALPADAVGFGGYRYRVRVARTVGVRARVLTLIARDSGCGAPIWRAGQRVAAFVSRSGGAWIPDGCGEVGPSRMRRALRPYPRAAGAGQVALLAAGQFGSARVMALDAEARVLAWGFGEGEALELSVCPGSRRAVELVRRGRRTLVAVRDLSSMAVVRQVQVARAARTVRCDDEAAASVHVGSLSYTRSRPVRGRVRVQRVGATTTAEVAGLPAENVALGPGSAYVWARGRLLAIRLSDGSTRELARIPLPTEIAASPDGARLAVEGYEDGLRVIDLASGVSHATEAPGLVGALLWVGSDRLLVRGNQRLRTYTTAPSVLRRYGFFRGIHYAPLDQRVFAVDGYRLIALDLDTGAKTRVPRLLPDRGINDLAAVPGQPAVAAERRAPRLGWPGARSAVVPACDTRAALR